MFNMADDELDAIRRKRLAEIQGQHGDFQGNPQAMQEQQERQEQEKVMKEVVLSQYLDQAARARLANIKAAKPEKAAMVENCIVRMAKAGQLGFNKKLNEESLKSLLANINQRTQTKTTTVKFDRRRAQLDDSDED